MMKGGFSIVSWPIVDDQVRLLDRLVDVIAFRERRSADIEVRSSSTVPLPIWVAKNGMPVFADEAGEIGWSIAAARARHRA